MKSFHQLREELNEGIFGSLGQGIKKYFGFSKGQDERLAAARDSVRKFLSNHKNPTWYHRILPFTKTVQSKDMLEFHFGWEYLWVYGDSNEKKTADYFLKNLAPKIWGSVYPARISKLKDEWDMESNNAAWMFSNTKCCQTGKTGPISTGEFEVLEVMQQQLANK